MYDTCHIYIYVRRRFDTGTLGPFEDIVHDASSNSEPKAFIYKDENSFHLFLTLLQNPHLGKCSSKTVVCRAPRLIVTPNRLRGSDSKVKFILTRRMIISHIA